MTDVMTRPDDTGEIPIGEKTADLGERTTLLRPMNAPPAEDPDGNTRRLTPPALDALLAVQAPRRPDADTTGKILYRVGQDAPATVGDVEGFTTSPTAPTRPLPKPPVPPQPPADMAAAQPVGYTGRHWAAETTPAPAVEPVLDAEPARTWPNLIPRLLDRLTLRGAR